MTSIVGVECLLKVRVYKGELIDSNDRKEVVRSTMFSFFPWEKKRAEETYV